MDLDIITVYISGYCWTGGNQINFFVRKVFLDFLYIMLEASLGSNSGIMFREGDKTPTWMSPSCGEQHFTHLSSSYIMWSLAFSTSWMSQSVLIHLPGQHMIHVVNTSVHTYFIKILHVDTSVSSHYNITSCSLIFENSFEMHSSEFQLYPYQQTLTLSRTWCMRPW